MVLLVESLQLVIIQALRNQQDGIGAVDPGLQQLVRIEDEIFPQQRPLDDLSNLLQVFERPLKMGRFGQDTDARGPVLLVGLGDGDRMKVRANHAFGRAGLFDFGNQFDSAGSGQCIAEGPHGRCGPQCLAQRRLASPPLGSLNFLPLDRNNPLKNTGHALCISRKGPSPFCATEAERKPATTFCSEINA